MADVVTVPRRLVRSAVVAIVVLTVLGVVGFSLFGVGTWQQHNVNDRLAAQDERILDLAEGFAHRTCEAINEGRADARELMRRGDLESGAVLVEESSRGRPLTEQQRAAIESYQKHLSERQAQIVAEHEADDHDCDAEASLRRQERKDHG